MEVLLRVEGCDDTFLAVELDATVASVRSQAGNDDWDFTLDSGGGGDEVLADDVRLCDLPAGDGIVLRARLCRRLAALHEIADQFSDAVIIPFAEKKELCPRWFKTRFVNDADGTLHDDGARLLRLVRQAYGVPPHGELTFGAQFTDPCDEGAVCAMLQACTDAGLLGGSLYWQLCWRVFSSASVRGAAILARSPPEPAVRRFEMLDGALAAPAVAVMLIEAGYPCQGLLTWSSRAVSIVSRGAHRDVVAAALNAGYAATVDDISCALRRHCEASAELLLRDCVKRGLPLDGRDKYAPIVVAARGNHTQTMQLLIKAGVNVRHAQGRLALCAAASCNSSDGVRMLLRSGADPTQCPCDTGDFADNALRVAACTGSWAMIQMLLDAGAQVDTSCLNAAAIAYRIAICKRLVEAADGAVPVPPWCWHEKEGTYGEKYNRARRREDYVRDVLIPHADTATKSEALVDATKRSCPGAVRLLLAAGVGEPEAVARMPTTHASSHGVAMLLATGYEVTPAVCVRLAPYVSWRCLGELLRKAGLSVADDVRGSGGDSLLHVAARHGRSRWIQRILLESCSHVNCTNDAGETPLSVAVQRKRLGPSDGVLLVCALLRGGADPDRVCSDSGELIRLARKALPSCHKRWSRAMRRAHGGKR